MAANTGKTNARWIRVWVDDATADATPREISLDVTNVTIPMNYSTADVTGYSDGVTNVTIGQPAMNVTMDGVFSNTALIGAHVVLSQIAGKDSLDTDFAPYTITIQIGIRKAPEATDPEFGGSFVLADYTVNGDLTWNASFHPSGSTAPAWTTV